MIIYNECRKNYHFLRNTQKSRAIPEYPPIALEKLKCRDDLPWLWLNNPCTGVSSGLESSNPDLRQFELVRGDGLDVASFSPVVATEQK